MATLLTADGRLLKANAPSVASAYGGSGFPGWFPPMWSDGTREPNGLTDSLDGPLVSYERLYRSQPVLAGVINKLARRIASLPFEAPRRTTDGRLEPVTGDSLDSLLRRPMPRWTTLQLNNHIAQSLLTHGNALVAKVRGPEGTDQPPVMLWPLDWSQISAYAPDGGRIEWWSTTQFGNQQRYLKAEDTIHFAWGAPSGSEIGVSPLEQLGVTIRIEAAAQTHQTTLFKDGVRPSLSVALKNEVKPDTMQMMRESIQRLHGGASNQGKVLFTAGGAEVKTLSYSPMEAALIEQRKLSREEVGMVYDLAGPLMNDLEHGTYSNVSELQKGLYRDVVPPWTELMVQTYGAQLLDPEPAWFDRVCRFDFGDKLRGEPRELAEKLKIEVEGGLRTRNEARKELGLPPLDDPAADQATANVNNQAPLSAMNTGNVGPDSPSPVNPPSAGPNS